MSNSNNNAIPNSNNNLEQRAMDRNVSFAKKGLFVAVFAAMLWGIYGTLMNFAYILPPLNATVYGVLLIPLVAGALEEFSGSIILFIRNLKNGKVKEYMRTLRTTPGKIICLGGALGGAVGIVGSMGAILYCSPAYALSIMAMYPVIGAVGSVIFLKEKTNTRFWAGLALCILGGITISYQPAEGIEGGTFYLGIILAVVAAIAWGIEGVLATYGTDTCDSDVGGGLRVMSGTVTAVVLLIVFSGKTGLEVLASCFTIYPLTFLAVFGVAICSSLSVNYWYRAFGMTGASRAMAINSTYGLWGILFSLVLSLFGLTEFILTSYLVIGAILMVVGVTLVVANPKELIRLRKVKGVDA